MEDVKSVKGRGCLHNKGTDTFSARVVTENGRLTSVQARALADLAETYGNGTVTLTTRQSFEVPGVPFGTDKGRQLGYRVYEAPLPPPEYAAGIIRLLSALTRKKVVRS